MYSEAFKGTANCIPSDNFMEHTVTKYVNRKTIEISARPLLRIRFIRRGLRNHGGIERTWVGTMRQAVYFDIKDIQISI